MDDELERARRAQKEAPDDVAAAVRLAIACERARHFLEAWWALVRLVGRTEDETEVLRALGGLAKRNPAATVAYLKQQAVHEPEKAVFSMTALGRAGELLPLVVFACEPLPDPLAFRARLELRKALEAAIPDLPGVEVLRTFVSSEDLVSWMPLIRQYASMLPEATELVAEFGRALTRAQAEELRGQPRAAVMLPVPPSPRGDLASWRKYARELIARARTEKKLVLLPWIAALFDCPDTALGAEAVVAFQALTGKLAPPLDPDDLAARWRS